MIGGLYFFVIVIANTIGAISGMGGGVLIKPTFDLIGAHSVVAISFYGGAVSYGFFFCVTLLPVIQIFHISLCMIDNHILHL